MYYYHMSYIEVAQLPWKVFLWLLVELKDLVKNDSRGVRF